MQDSQVLGWETLARESSGLAQVDWFFLFAYCVLPLSFLAVAYSVFRIDPYELWLKFLPIWVAMVVEIILTLAWQIFGIGIPSNLMQMRLGFPFLHLFYFVPAIYCMCRPNLRYHMGPEGGGFAPRIRSLLSWLFRDASFVYLPFFMVLLTGFVLASSEKSHRNFIDHGFFLNKNNVVALNLLTKNSRPGDMLVGPNASTNIGITITGRYGSLWVNRFSDTHISVDSAIEKFAVLGKIFGWTEDNFLSFMLPQNPPIHLSRKVFSLLSTEAIPGLGYWMVFHKSPLDLRARKKLSNKLRTIFSSTNLAERLKEYNVRRIVMRNKPVFPFLVTNEKVGNYWVINLP